jgi:preprotein translocase subunit SecF
MLHFFASLFTLVGFVVTAAATLVAFGLAREYVRNRLRFVDGVRHPIAPWLAALVVTVILTPVVALIHIVPIIGSLVGFGTALFVGAGTGLGTASGIKALKRGE